MPVEFDLEHGFHAGITEDVINQNFASFIDAIGGSHVQTSLEGDSNATFPRKWHILGRKNFKFKEKFIYTSSNASLPMSSTTVDQAFPFAFDVEVLVGNFKLVGGTKDEVIGIVIRRALQSVTTALLHLWERVDRPRLSSIADQRGAGGTDAREETQSQEPPTSNFSPSFGAQDIGALLSSLSDIMQAIQKDL
ncbi:hypothetical protein ABKA04_002114 [Annulohypoxylon sp. FPYF3050]